MMYPMFFDWTMLLVLPAILFAGWAQSKVKSTFNRYSRETTQRGLTAAQVARTLLDRFGLTGVPVNHVGGELTDHYDPRNKTLSLSDSVYDSRSIAAIGVAAHEVGHAIQHNTGYAPLAIRNTIVPVASLTSSLSIPLFFLGLIMASSTMMNWGIFLFLGALLFQVITLPVEYNASSRAITILGQTGELTSDELRGAGNVLNAAALTYVAATLTTVMTLVRLLVLRGMRSNNN